MAGGARRKQAKPELQVAFVLLPEEVMPDAEAVTSAYADICGDADQLRRQVESPLEAIRRSARGEPAEGEGMLTLRLGTKGEVNLALMPLPVPNDEADHAARCSVSSIGTGWKLARHRAHLIVTYAEPSAPSRVIALTRFTQLLAAVAQASGAVGVYWGEAGATHEPRFFINVARDGGPATMITLWTGVSVAQDGPTRMSLLSLGLGQLSLPNLLLTAPRERTAEALEMFFDLIAYLVERGAPIPDGDTIGRDERERLRVQYVASPLAPAEQVWRVEVP